MLRPGKDLQEPLSPKAAENEDVENGKFFPKKNVGLIDHLAGFAIWVLNGNLFMQYWYAFDRDSKYLIPAELLVLVLMVMTIFQTHLRRSNTTKAIRQGYLVFLGLSLFLPLTLSYIWMAIAITAQGMLLGMDLLSLLKEDEKVNAELVDEDAVLGSPLDSSTTHWGIQCSNCNKLHLVGVRYKAIDTLTNMDIDLCEACFGKWTASGAIKQYTSIEKMHQPEPLTPEMFTKLREEEARLRKQKMQRKANLERENTLLAGKDLNVV